MLLSTRISTPHSVHHYKHRTCYFSLPFITTITTITITTQCHYHHHHRCKLSSPPSQLCAYLLPNSAASTLSAQTPCPVTLCPLRRRAEFICPDIPVIAVVVAVTVVLVHLIICLSIYFMTCTILWAVSSDETAAAAALSCPLSAVTTGGRDRTEKASATASEGVLKRRHWWWYS